MVKEGREGGRGGEKEGERLHRQLPLGLRHLHSVLLLLLRHYFSQVPLTSGAHVSICSQLRRVLCSSLFRRRFRWEGRPASALDVGLVQLLTL